VKLLYTLTAYPPYIGGAQLHQHFLAQQLQKQHDLQVVCHWKQNRTDWLLGTTLFAPSKGDHYIINNIPVHRLGFSAWEKIPLIPAVLAYYPFMNLALPPIAQRIAKHLAPFTVQTDLVHNVRIGREGLSYASLQVARSHDIPFVLTPVHHPRWVGWRYREYLKLYTLADAVITLTHVEKQTLVQLGVAEDRIAVTGIGPILANEANPEQFLHTYNLNGSVILFLGQHYSYKGYRQLLEAAPLVWEKFPDTQFVFMGPPVKQSEQDFKDIDRRIHRLGQVDLQTKTDALSACTMLCVPSSQESFGGVYTEAWSFGKPVIGCPIPAVSEVVTDGIDGYLVNQEPFAIAEAICHLLSNPSLAKAMGQAGRYKVAQHYTWEKLAQKTEKVYEAALSGKPS
jgi:glycosyltransferase involved in cell wall biosynthesis